jgi:bifunctional non-homologous end joining protein LigD
MLPVRALQLALLVDEVPTGDEWLHEMKFDGYRILAERTRKHTRLYSRRFKDWTAEFPSIAAAVAALPVKSAVLDGEVAVVLPDGRTSFQALQNAFSGEGANLVYFVFDVLELDGESLVALPLEARKARLAKLVKKAGVIRYSDHVLGNGKQFFAMACKSGLEGIVSKRRAAPYTPGRSAAWQKIKCIKRQELVIGGYTERSTGKGLGALLVGYYDGDDLRYAGKVGTGFTNKTLDELYALLAPHERATSPFVDELGRSRSGSVRHWVKPKFVAEVAFSEWTDEGKLRHPSFQGLRRDKSPREVVRE